MNTMSTKQEGAPAESPNPSSSNSFASPRKPSSGMNLLNSPKNLPRMSFSLPGDNSDAMLDDDSHSVGTGSRRGSIEPEDKLASRETNAVNSLRICVILVLTASAAAVCCLAYFLTSNNEEADFEAAFLDQATRVVDAFQINAQKRVGALQAFALSITSHAIFSDSTWPFVTLPDFERRATATSELAEVMSMIMAPLVTDEQRLAWETYSVANQGWFEEGIQVQRDQAKEEKQRQSELEAAAAAATGGGRARRHLVNDDTPGTLPHRRTQSGIPDEIYRVKGLTPSRERGPGPYLPQWQIAPVVPVPSLVNFNLLSHVGYEASLNAVLESQVAIVGRSVDFSDPRDEQTAGRRDVFDLFLTKWGGNEGGTGGDATVGATGGATQVAYEEDPIADLHVPIYDGFQTATRKLVGVLTCVVYWRTYFVDILPESAKGIIVLLENTCGQKYTYQIDGPIVSYVGPGDQHDTQFNHLVLESEEGAYLHLQNDLRRNYNGSCLYQIKVYPSSEFASSYITNQPRLYTIVMVLIFCFTSLTFMIYDCLVERRQRVVMDTAVASSAIVSSLFPKVVRDRLYNAEQQQQKQQGGGGVDAAKKSKKNTDTDDIFNTNDAKDNAGGGATTDHEMTTIKTRPIADLFDNCTVLFADIAGFTAWSSDREPSDVFYLLETLYGALDKIAKKRRVFKVETIGDCYLAVTGLPNPQPDHAIIMCMFANECLKAMLNLVTKELPPTLGEDTMSLSMRFGLHSGPVTAGVLRGEKSRFQLFGDTVNTAARMESTGLRDRIQLSQATADLVVMAGKGVWLEERADTVDAKGKGTLQTYWFKSGRSRVKRGDSIGPGSGHAGSRDDRSTAGSASLQDSFN